MKFSKKEIIIKSWNQILPNLSLLILCVGFIFLTKFLNDSAWLLLENLKKQGFSIKEQIFDQKTKRY